MIVILMGAPGAGKGTQANYLKDSLGFRKISTGDILRKHIAAKSELGKKIETIVSAGHLVSDDILQEVLRQEIEGEKNANVVLDGFPRSQPQAEWLEENVDTTGVIHIDVGQEELIRRIEGRLTCEKCEAVYHVTDNPPKKEGICDRCKAKLVRRKDDVRSSILVRLDAYDKQTSPVLGFYKKKGKYFRLDGNGKPATINKDLLQLMKKLER
ncbi:MAG: nucleoside monophosphate kinase [Deltaproteobacteria bacterium]|nr:nucleoside monophosphate kinase [Deltaproteobacteria bacterium]